MSFRLINSHQNLIRILKQCIVDFLLELSYLGIVVLSLSNFGMCFGSEKCKLAENGHFGMYVVDIFNSYVLQNI